jgi:hypothetical protein
MQLIQEIGEETVQICRYSAQIRIAPLRIQSVLEGAQGVLAESC